MIGTILGGRYEIIEEIGKGGMAYVYKARCTLLNRIVAVKILRDDLEGETEFLKRFNVEAQAAASLTHSNIVSIFDVGCDNGRHYIIMEYVDGITLKEYISEKGNLEYREALSIAYQISGALQAAHQKNIVHRDIKPHNILVTEDGKIKVTDFGIARSSTHKTISSNGDIIGSVHYISPEQAKGEMVDTRSDIYSLGIVIHEMITGRVPFDGDTPVAVAMMQIESKPSNRMLNEFETPVSVQQIIFKAMAKEPELRYQDADELKSDILNVLHDVNFKIDNGDLYMDFDDAEEDIAHKKESRSVKSIFARILIITASFITALAIVLFATYIYVNGTPDITSSDVDKNKVTVPDLKGMVLSEAEEMCEKLTLNIVVDDEIVDDNLEPEEIISQTPECETLVDKNGIIKVVISKAVETAMLSEYVGSDYKDAQEELVEHGYNVNIVFEESKKQADTVIRQTPQAGKKVKKDSFVTLYVSSGVNSSDKYISVPNLVGKSYSQCVSTLKSLGLSVSHSSASEPDGDLVVIGQAIPSGSLVSKDCVVMVTVEPESNPDSEVSDESDSKNNKTESSDDKKTENNQNDSTHGKDSTSEVNENQSDNKKDKDSLESETNGEVD